MLSYSAFNNLLRAWKADGSPALISFAAFYLPEWIDSLRFAIDRFEDEIDCNLLNLDEKGKVHYLEQVRFKLDKALPIISGLPTSVPTNLASIVQNRTSYANSAFYLEVEEALKSDIDGQVNRLLDERTSMPFQNEYIQGSFLRVFNIIAELITSYNPANDKQDIYQRNIGAPPPFIWKSGLSDLLDLFLTLQEKNHLDIRPIESPLEVSKAVTELFQLPPSLKQSQLEDWERFKQYFATTENEKPKVYSKRAKKSFFEQIKPHFDK